MLGHLRLGLCLVLLMQASPWAAPGPACSGVAGAGCSPPEGQFRCQRLAGSSGLECIVSAGSIEHDLCCQQHPAGRGCGGRPGDARHCEYEWGKAQERLTNGLYWTRRFLSAERGRSTAQGFAEVCAPPGTVVAAGDERWCCARSAIALAERDQQGVNKLRCR
jgi:hypothetical protein